MKQVPLSEVAEFINGRAFKPEDWQTEGLPIIRIQNLTGSTDTVNYYSGKVEPRYLVRNDDILISWSASLGVYKWQGGDAILNQHIFKVELKEKLIDKEYFYYAAQNALVEMESHVHGATMQHITRDPFLAIEIPLPPLTEQKRIASLLARADRLRQLRRTAHDLGDALLQSVFLEMFGNVTHSKWDKSELGELIEGFEAGVNYLPGGEGEKVSEWRVLKISAVTWGDFDPTESKAIREYDGFDEKHIVRKGDLLISRANTTELVGAVSLVKIIPPKVLLPDKLWRVKFRKDSAILPEYTLHLLRQPELRKIIGDLATGSSGSMKNISMEKAYTLPIPVPPLSLQEEFAGVVARVESLRGRMGESTRGWMGCLRAC